MPSGDFKILWWGDMAWHHKMIWRHCWCEMWILVDWILVLFDCKTCAVIHLCIIATQLVSNELLLQLNTSSCLPLTSQTVRPIDTFEECSASCSQVAADDVEVKIIPPCLTLKGLHILYRLHKYIVKKSPLQVPKIPENHCIHFFWSQILIEVIYTNENHVG